MSNFLFLVNRLKSETGVTGPALTDIAYDHGTEQARLVQWIKDSYKEICAKSDDYSFLRSSFSLNTVANQEAYQFFDCTDTVLSIAIEEWEFNKWRTDTFTYYLTNSVAPFAQELPYLPWEDFRLMYVIRPPLPGPPQFFSVRPNDNAIVIGPKPNDVYTIAGDYQRMAAELQDKADELLFGPQYAEIVVWNAIHRYMAFEEDPGGWQHAKQEFLKMLGPFQRRYLPIPWLGGR